MHSATLTSRAALPQGPADAVDIVPERAEHRWLRVALVTETYPPEVNGVAGTVAKIVEGLREAGHELQLVRPRQHKEEAAQHSEGFAELLMRGLPIPRYPQLRMGLPAKRALLRRWSFERPDVVHIATEGPLGWSALQAARQLRLPVLSEFRTNFHAYSQHYGIGWLRHPIHAYLRRFHNRCDLSLVPSEDLRATLAAQGFERLDVVARGVDGARFNPAKRSSSLRALWGAQADTPVLLCVGRLAPEKNLDLLLDAYLALKERRPDARLVLVGDGPERERLQRRCPQAHFAGLRVGEDLAGHYASADLFVFPSTTETFGNVVPEAMASGLAVVAFDYAAAGQLLRDGVGGIKPALGDTAGFRQAVVALGGDAARRTALAHSGLERVQALGWTRIVSQLETHYRALLRPL